MLSSTPSCGTFWYRWSQKDQLTDGRARSADSRDVYASSNRRIRKIMRCFREPISVQRSFLRTKALRRLGGHTSACESAYRSL